MAGQLAWWRQPQPVVGLAPFPKTAAVDMMPPPPSALLGVEDLKFCEIPIRPVNQTVW
jgi:hypothetical protein